MEGVPVRRSIQEVDDEIDLAVITIPARFVFDSIQELCRVKVKNAIIISAGF
ncbi:MAG: hypothetical protein LLG93_13650 [Deltaproteobacteria bacterium]|nr:hypothetical protein [Deltaproteobacteria bacterium]